jgi:hypothetical protein
MTTELNDTGSTGGAFSAGIGAQGIEPCAPIGEDRAAISTLAPVHSINREEIDRR